MERLRGLRSLIKLGSGAYLLPFLCKSSERNSNMDNNQNENKNLPETEESGNKANFPLIIGLSLILVALIIFGMVTIDKTGSNNVGNSTSNVSSNKSISTISEEEIIEQRRKDREEATEAPTAKNNVSIVVSDKTITIDGKEYTAKEAADYVASLGSDYGAILTDNDASLITMTDLFEALSDKGIIYNFE